MLTGTGTARTHDAVVRAYLRERGVPFDVFIHPRVLTGIAEARAIGVNAGEVLKTLVVDTVRGQALLVLPASRRIDMHRVREAVADPHARLATEAEILRDYPGIQPGALPPLGSLFGQPVFVDPSVFEHDTVIFAAGIQTESLLVRTEDLFDGEEVHVTSLTHHVADDGERDDPFG